jgi:hypothetical protein
MPRANAFDKKSLILEYAKCSANPTYVIESYFETFDKTQEGYVPFNLFEKQKTLIKNYQENRFNIVLKYRQAGISTVTAAYAAVVAGFASKDNPERILILANKQETAIEFQNKIINFIKQLPEWVGITFDKSSQKHVKLSNGSEIKSVATSLDAMRGYTPTLMILDEAAFIEGGQSLWTACLASIGTGGNAILISTPNGLDEIYYEAYEGSIRGKNKMKITHLKWWQDPRFNKDLRLVKTANTVDWIQKPDKEKEEDIVIEHALRFSFEMIEKYIEDGYKPHSTWYENMCRDMNLNKRMINQELECVDFKTIITIRDSNTGEIKKIKIGDLYGKLNKINDLKYDVLTPNGYKNFIGIQKLKKNTIELFFDNGLTLRGSLNHQVYDNEGKPKTLSEIKMGDKIKADKGYFTVTKIKTYRHKTNVYDLIEVDGGNIYYTNKIISHNCAFIGSGDNVIEGSIIRKQEETNVKEPILKDREWDNNLWIWELPQSGHRYIGALDVSRGDSEDSTAYCIIDYDTFEQVLEYQGKIPPDIAAVMVDKYSRMYNALTTFDITGGMGIAATAKLKEMRFPKKLLHYDLLDDNNYFSMATDDMTPGINYASKNRRSQIVAALEEAIARGGFKLRSQRLANELKKFVYKNGKPDHLKGSHDDCLMSLGMCLFVANTSFKKLHESDNSTKAMLDSWKVRDNEINTNADYLLKDTINMTRNRIHNDPQEINNINFKNTRDFGWLFGKFGK